MLRISWQEHRTNDSILIELGLERELIGRVAKLKLQYFGHITRGSAGQLALTVLKGIVVSAVLRVVFGGNGNLMVLLDFIILNSRPRMHVQNQRT